MRIESHHRAESYGMSPEVDRIRNETEEAGLSHLQVCIISQIHAMLPHENRELQCYLDQEWTADVCFLGFQLRSLDLLLWTKQITIPANSSSIIELWCNMYDMDYDHVSITTHKLNLLPTNNYLRNQRLTEHSEVQTGQHGPS